LTLLSANIPELPGRTLILIDTSASMGQPLSRKSTMTMVQAAALFGLATGIRNRDRADLYGFADGQFRVETVRVPAERPEVCGGVHPAHRGGRSRHPDRPKRSGPPTAATTG
jgi:hypothetical protein